MNWPFSTFRSQPIFSTAFHFRYGFCQKKAQQYKLSYSAPTLNQTCPLPLLDHQHTAQTEPKLQRKSKCDDRHNEDFVWWMWNNDEIISSCIRSVDNDNAKGLYVSKIGWRNCKSISKLISVFLNLNDKNMWKINNKIESKLNARSPWKADEWRYRKYLSIKNP